MTESGFEPPTITIPQNSEVEFKNLDNTLRWPASDIHPTHGIYPQFDPKKPIQPGDSWVFKPKKVGTWKYHDHLLPHQRGTVTVVAEGEVQSNLEKVKSWFWGIINFLKNLFSKEDASKNWEVLREKYKGKLGFSGDIHDQAHLAGCS